MNRNFVLSAVGLILLGICVSRIKYEVVFLRKHLKYLNEEITRISDDIKVYGAEWSYLNDPKRLKQLAEKYLPQLKPMSNKQILSYNEFVRNDYDDKTERSTFESFLNSIS